MRANDKEAAFDAAGRDDMQAVIDGMATGIVFLDLNGATNAADELWDARVIAKALLAADSDDYSPAFQDEYQRLWHRAASDLSDARAALREVGCRRSKIDTCLDRYERAAAEIADRQVHPNAHPATDPPTLPDLCVVCAALKGASDA